MARPAPAASEIIDALALHHRTGFPVTRNDAVTAVRIHFGTTDRKALEWLLDIVVQQEPLLYEVWGSSRGFVSVIRPNTNRALIPSEPEGRRIRTTFKSVGLKVDTICVDQHGQFTGRRPETGPGECPWLLPPALLRELGDKQATANAEANAKARQRRDQEDAAFERDHPGALDHMRAALGPIVENFDASVGVHPSSNGRHVLSIMLSGKEISEFAELLRTCTPASTQE